MTKLFRFEYRRLFRQKSFWIFMAVAAALAFLSLGAFKLIEIATNITSDMNDVDTYFGIGYTGAEAFRNATSLGDIDIVIAIVAAIFVCSEYSRGTISRFRRIFTLQDFYGGVSCFNDGSGSGLCCIKCFRICIRKHFLGNR